MALITTDEQEALREVMRGFLGKYSDEATVRAVMAGDRGYDPAAWRTAAEQIGVQGLLIPEQFGGGGCGFDEMAVVLEEAGRTLFPAPLLSTAVLATTTLLAVGGAEEHLGRIAAGELIATVAVAERKLAWDPDDVHTTATRRESGWVLTGAKPYVLDGAQAELLLVAARTPAGVSLFAVEAGAPGLSVTPRDPLDQTRRQAAVGFDNTPAVLLGEEGAGWQVLAGVYDHALTALACEQVGGAQAALEMTVGYLNVRQQFGRPIGSFQALKHRCADLLVEVESARSAAAYASAAVAAGADDAPVAASIAKVYCSQAFYHVAAETIQMHGGIGFTWEHPAHLYFKRAKSSEALFGWPADHRDRIARLTGLVA
ncbi:acyl-CoA dehydrogenase, C-terminal domain protein [Mycolicibacterium hassiacum DSM 44199]|jgi:alkylation response protein AidB-like acyl-CoA dehydrogenase|uniref:Acyl-CoA dehydrogenase, C-terminal domain protein n=1 Tax=Mycolicibacterium hassiacum (strain DSM 44199 / CIP 105218 / JCM 12690 / 3849) TaxID=1122247 RepID=K5B9W3_MYCHD|nr:acyl-CoA dehydrogenase family protein [Mycolicibacterium hassiacum]EKF21190.1 acyl-CoA dehydrogenase, C-terminal domain protein [Mycolicibacterium hassiacum DSM 44199]MBX5487394.1 acyl-CoA/acyl-ACP dehydrogenase [Mycolicibacterium hassiacum]MDA4086413.1 acyl-CoA dehydrogenase [Mycolicibacterium hassiacum DSM 44199]VCT91388.1 Acryloyl-CoA reductase (NADH) [Mycolicibacterium hassiacum DSM 44199]